MKQRFIISRNDAIGDVVLTLPVATLLKKNYPNCEVIFLARNYVKDIVAACPDVDQFLSWDELLAMPSNQAIQTISDLQADTILHIKPHPKVAKYAKAAGIKTRIGTSRRWYHWLTCNKRVSFSRAKSDLHEAQLNLKLLRPLNLPEHLTIEELTELTHLKPQQAISEKIQRLLDPNKFNLIVHPLSHGHSREWPLNYYRALINDLPKDKFNIIITGSPAEREKLENSLIKYCTTAKVAAGELTLGEMLTLIKHCDGILVGSTGPLHMAAAVGIRTLGLFPPIKAMSAYRWGPVGKNAQYLMLEKDCNTCDWKPSEECVCIRAITVGKVKQTIMEWLQNQ